MASAKDILGGLGGVFSATRTAFGFIAIVLIALCCTTYGILKVLSTNNGLVTLIPKVLIGSGVLFFLIVASVLLILYFRPERLMLGEVKAEVFIKLLQLRQGDSETGEVIEDVIVSPASALPQEPKQLAGVRITDQGEDSKEDE